MKTLILSLVVVFTGMMPIHGAGFDHSHAALTKILKGSVHGPRVNYAGLKKDPAALDAYVSTLGAVSKSSFDRWSRSQQMAYLINAYNANTLKLVVDHYPIKSIKDIGGRFRSPWKRKVVVLFGEKVSLDHIEHDLLRPWYKDPRIHFAVNCASIGCPPLRAEAFTAAKLEKQLDEQGRAFLRDPSKNRVDARAGKIHLSKIFEWFKGDFTAKSGTVENFIKPYLSEADRKVVSRGGLGIVYNDYDWGLNQ